MCGRLRGAEVCLYGCEEVVTHAGLGFYDDSAVLRPLRFPVRKLPSVLLQGNPINSLARQAEFGGICLLWPEVGTLSRMNRHLSPASQENLHNVCSSSKLKKSRCVLWYSVPITCSREFHRGAVWHFLQHSSLNTLGEHHTIKHFLACFRWWIFSPLNF